MFKTILHSYLVTVQHVLKMGKRNLSRLLSIFRLLYKNPLQHSYNIIICLKEGSSSIQAIVCTQRLFYKKISEQLFFFLIEAKTLPMYGSCFLAIVILPIPLSKRRIPIQMFISWHSEKNIKGINLHSEVSFFNSLLAISDSSKMKTGFKGHHKIPSFWPDFVAL